VAPSPKLEKFQKRGVVRGKLIKVSYFQEQGLEVFLDKLKAQGWYELFTNTQMGCSQPNVALFGDVLTSTANGVLGAASNLIRLICPRGQVLAEQG